ncbi:hypothetical protein COY23_03525 [bacterium (Candidatus Torokbacteria) CG_4_10_14_0_2_um_filter_35_8]|nr:MAG: hypothetical protein COY23_03525 [bacterium (Candidatus Torokbacteria) CG_4_10_14_0_2_um_filter_35_8]
MAIIRWNPFQETMSLRDAMDQLFEDSMVSKNSLSDVVPACDIYQDKDNLYIEIPLAGVDPKDVDISIKDDVLTAKGETKRKEEIKRKDYYRNEVQYGSFSRSISLPVRVKGDKASADSKNGMLKITMPKAEEAKPKKITVNLGTGK